MKTLILLWILFLGTGLLSSPLQAKSEDKTDSKKMCAQTQAQIRDQEAKKKKIGEENTLLEGQFNEAQKKYQVSQSRLQGQSNCSRGRPNNTAECEEILSAMRKSTAEMDKIQEQINKSSADLLGLDVELDKSQQLSNAYACH